MAKFIPNPFLEKQVAASEGMKNAEKEIAEEIAQRAQSIAPVLTGAYRDSIHVEEEGLVVRVVADVEYAAAIEFGTSDTPTFAPLRRAAQK